MPYVFFLFVAMPIVEIALLLRVGSAMGWLPTLLIVITTAFIGSAMLRVQGLATMNKARERMNAGEMPAQQLLEGVLIMIGGVLLLTPGFVTDALGFSCLIPFTRQLLASKLSARVITGIGVPGTAGPAAGARRSRTDHAPDPLRDNTGDIIDGDFKRIDDE